MSKVRSTRSPQRLLVKLRPSLGLTALESSGRLVPLHDDGGPSALGLVHEPRWYIADVEGDPASPWDLAHGRVADQLGVASSDVVFAEPDLVHSIHSDPCARAAGPLALGADCRSKPQEGAGGKAIGPGFAWHLGEAFTQLRRAQESIVLDRKSTRLNSSHSQISYAV